MCEGSGLMEGQCIVNEREEAHGRLIIGGSRGGVPGARPPTGPNSFIFAYIFTEKCPRWRPKPPKMGPRPPMENPGSGPVKVW